MVVIKTIGSVVTFIKTLLCIVIIIKTLNKVYIFKTINVIMVLAHMVGVII